MRRLFTIAKFGFAVCALCCAQAALGEDLSIIEHRDVGSHRAHQGVTSDGESFYVSKGADWITFPERISRYDLDPWTFGVEVDADYPSVITHVGDISAGPNYVYAAVDNSSLLVNDSASFTGISRYSRNSLSSAGYWDISSETAGSAIAGVDYYHNALYVVTYRKDEDTTVLKYNLDGSNLDYTDSYTISTRKVNGIEFYGNYMYVSAGSDSDTGWIEVYNFDNMSTTGTNTPGGSWTYAIRPSDDEDKKLWYDHAEGLTFHEDQLWVAQRTSVNKLTVPVYPDYVTWQGEAGNTNWDSFFNWDGKPTSNTGVVFDKDSQVSLGSNNITTRSFVVRGGGFVNFDLNNRTYTSSQDAIIGQTSGSASLYIGDGAFECREMYIGHGASATGNLYVVGAGGTDLLVNGDMVIGLYGTGTLDVSLGGRVDISDDLGIGSNTGSSGIVTVGHSGSALAVNDNVYVGDYGTGTVIQTGGTITVGGQLYVGNLSGSDGTVTITGTGSTWTNSSALRVGNSGQGTLNITNGGAVISNSSGYIGRYPGSTGLVTVDGSGSTWTNSGSLYIGGSESGSGGTGELTVGNGGSVEVGSTLKVWGGGTLHIGATGKVTVGEALGVAGTLTIGNTGTLNINGGSVTTGSFDNTAGGTFNFAGGSMTIDSGSFNLGAGNYTLNGAGNPTLIVKNNAAANLSGQLTISDTDSAAMFIENGADVSNTNAYIGRETGSDGTVTVDGSGSTWTCGYSLYVGLSGQGTLNIANGGAVSNSNGYIGDGSGSIGVVTVDGHGSTWTNSSTLYVGRSGHGTLNITNGGAVSNKYCYIGDKVGYTGEVTVDGSGSTWTSSGDLYVCLSGQGTLNITNGGAVSNNYGHIGYYSGSTGEVTVDGSGSTWTNSDDLYVGGNYSSSGGTGELTLSNGGIVEVGNTLKIWSTGTVQGDGTITANVIINAGTVKPGISPGTLSVNGNYMQVAEGSLEIELAGTTPGSGHDQVAITCLASLAGTLELSLIEPYMPDYYDEFTIMTAGAVSGRFDLIEGVAAFPDKYLAVVYNADNVLVVAALPSDANLGGSVDVGDLGILAGSYGQTEGMVWATGDFTGDGAVNVADLGVLAANYGATESTIPEPASAVLLLSGSVPAMFRRRKKS